MSDSASAYVVVPVKHSKSYTHLAWAKVSGNKKGKDKTRTCYVQVTEKGTTKKSKKIYSEDVTQKQAKAYLDALSWQGQCTNGVRMLYYLVK